jgi:hypothetical protein
MLTIESGAAALFERACRELLIERNERERGRRWTRQPSAFCCHIAGLLSSSIA